ncbi:hypothetical protein GCM10022421_32430 [Oceanisphaera sediminis]|uniref:NTP pyrophosphohydrolase MazG putative catalytic core domain-containing protein n=1 Tax=Oceanisphaera sediminis TaxID=981381 RepID=A0ABP7EQF2_9GAMM
MNNNIKVNGAIESICDHILESHSFHLPPGGITPEEALAGIIQAQHLCHGLAKTGGWWNDISTGEPLQRNKGELLMLIVSEVAEAMEGERKGLMDDKLPHRPMAEVELADAMIRILDYAGGYGYDVAGALVEKLAYNMSRADHKPENRAAANGKKF